jgi:hypothetical protein
MSDGIEAIYYGLGFFVGALVLLLIVAGVSDKFDGGEQ